MSSPMRSRSRIVKDGERSTVYQVREAARHDLYQQEMSQRASLRRPRSYDQRDEEIREDLIMGRSNFSFFFFSRATET